MDLLGTPTSKPVGTLLVYERQLAKQSWLAQQKGASISEAPSLLFGASGLLGTHFVVLFGRGRVCLDLFLRRLLLVGLGRFIAHNY
jgi:hypothetical protein